MHQNRNTERKYVLEHTRWETEIIFKFTASSMHGMVHVEMEGDGLRENYDGKWYEHYTRV